MINRLLIEEEKRSADLCDRSAITGQRLSEEVEYRAVREASFFTLKVYIIACCNNNIVLSKKVLVAGLNIKYAVTKHNYASQTSMIDIGLPGCHRGRSVSVQPN